MPETRPLRLVFVCTGNICRSPMAAAFAWDYATLRQRPVEVQSASAMGLDGHKADATAVKVMEEVGLDISDHESQPLTAELVEWADYVLVAEVQHASRARELTEKAEGKVLLLGSFIGQIEIPDPLGSWRWRYRRIRDDIRRAVETFIDQVPAR